MSKYKFIEKKSADYRVTIDMIEKSIVKEEYHKLGSKMTACVLTLDNGHEVVGIAGVVDPSKYNKEIGSKYAREKAIEKLWPLFGYAMQLQMHYDNRFNDYPEEDIKLDSTRRMNYLNKDYEETRAVSELAEETNNCCSTR